MPSVIFFLPTISGYEDRVRLLMAASDHLERLTLMVGYHDRPVDFSAHPNFDLVDLGFRRRMRPLNMWKSARAAEAILRRQGADVVHDTMGTLYPLFRKKRRFPSARFVTSFFILFGWRLSHVWNRHSPLRLLSTPSTAMMYPNRWLERRMALLADRVVLQAPGLIPHLTSDVPSAEDKCHVITNNVETDFWQPGPEKQGSDRLNLLFVGGVDHSKGVFVLLRTMAQLRDRGIAATLTVIGEVNRISQAGVNQAVRHLRLHDSVRFQNRVDRVELRDKYRRGDLFIYQTINDGSPRVVLEALSCGLPVVASRHPGIQVIDPDERFIAFSDFGDVQYVADQIESYRRNPEEWSKRSMVGMETVRSSFSTNSVARQYVDFYNAIAGETASASPASNSG